MSTGGRAEAATVNSLGDEAFQFLGLRTQVRSSSETSGGAFCLVEHWLMPPGFATPYHTHHREDEAFYVLEGEFAFVCEGKWQRGGPGTYVFGPRELAHGFKVVAEAPARMLILASPGGFDRFVAEFGEPLSAPVTPPDIPKLIATAAKYGIDIHGPLPEE